MPFRIPTFNLTANLWSGNPPPPYPPVGVPRLTVSCQLAASRDALFVVGPIPHALSLIRFPAGTDVRDPLATTFQDVVEVPVASGNWYAVEAVVDVARGFGNEYRQALLVVAQVNTPRT